MADAIRVIAGRCTVRHEADRTSESVGDVVVLVKPDNTVLVHDAAGYRPAGWLTRAESVQVSIAEGQFRLRATSGDETLEVAGEDPAVAEFPTTAAGPTVGTCPACGDDLVRSGSTVTRLGCGEAYPLPRDAAVTGDTCEDCGLPTIAVERGTELTVCLDRDCESIDDAVAAAFDGEWVCPTCGDPLSIERDRTLGAACEACGTHYPIPSGTVAGTCACGLPIVETEHGSRCLDPQCQAAESHINQ